MASPLQAWLLRVMKEAAKDEKSAVFHKSKRGVAEKQGLPATSDAPPVAPAGIPDDSPRLLNKESTGTGATTEISGQQPVLPVEGGVQGERGNHVTPRQTNDDVSELQQPLREMEGFTPTRGPNKGQNMSDASIEHLQTTPPRPAPVERPNIKGALKRRKLGLAPIDRKTLINDTRDGGAEYQPAEIEAFGETNLGPVPEPTLLEDLDTLPNRFNGPSQGEKTAIDEGFATPTEREAQHIRNQLDAMPIQTEEEGMELARGLAQKRGNQADAQLGNTENFAKLNDLQAALQFRLENPTTVGADGFVGTTPDGLALDRAQNIMHKFRAQMSRDQAAAKTAGDTSVNQSYGRRLTGPLNPETKARLKEEKLAEDRKTLGLRYKANRKTNNPRTQANLSEDEYGKKLPVGPRDTENMVRDGKAFKAGTPDDLGGTILPEDLLKMFSNPTKGPTRAQRLMNDVPTQRMNTQARDFLIQLLQEK